MTAAPFSIDLDAARRELAFPDGIPVVLGGETFLLPAEFPIDAIDPLLDKDFDLVGLIREALASEREGIGEAVVELLTQRPDLPVEVLDTFYACLALLFGAEEFERFKAHRPGLHTYAALLRGMFKAYGTSLGEAFASPDSSESAGATQKQISDASTDSTPAPSSDAPAPETASSASAG